MEKLKELKPCPFCGGEPRFTGSDNVNGHPYWYVTCNDCLAGTCGDEDKDKAVANWNRRVNDEAV